MARIPAGHMGQRGAPHRPRTHRRHQPSNQPPRPRCALDRRPSSDRLAVALTNEAPNATADCLRTAITDAVAKREHGIEEVLHRDQTPAILRYQMPATNELPM